MKTVSYRQYQASVNHCGGEFFVKVLHIDDLLIGACNSISEAQRVLEELVEDYLLDCAAQGRQPNRGRL
jgi:predicted HicB family RNase H-like nuclease